MAEEPGVKVGRALRKQLRAGALTLLPFQIALAPVLGTLFGYWADKSLGSFPWLTVTGLVLGILAAGRAVARAIKEVQR